MATQGTERKTLYYDHAAQAERLDPDNAMVQLIYGRIERRRRQFDRVEQHRLARAFQVAPKDEQILRSLAIAKPSREMPNLATN